MKLCLNMIVRNEAPIIERSLASTIGHINYYVIGDTGSSDATMEIIKTFFGKHNVPGEIHQFPFINFAQARNCALEFAKVSPGDFDFILLNDADMELKADPGWKKNIIFPVCSIRQTNDFLSYYNARLLHRAIEARYIGKTHEYLSTPMASQPIEGVWFLDHANGSSRSEKTERDLRLLKESLAENPNDQRSLFYIANTLKDLGRYYDALGYYKRRIKAGGWDEEVWYSAYMAAFCHKQLGNEAQFIAKSLEAFEMRPWRAEPLLPLATHYREAGKNHLALMISERGAEVPYPVNDQLFVENFVYEHGFAGEISIAGFYATNGSALQRRQRQRGYEEAARLGSSTDAPEYLRKMALKNSRFYAKNAVELLPSFVTTELKVPEELISKGYVESNPSIALHPDGNIHCIIRTVNYRMNNGVYTAPDDIVNTENYICELDDDLKIVRSAPIDHGDFSNNRTDFAVRGYEDCRLFWWRNEWWATATIRDRHPEGVPEMALFNVNGDKEFVFQAGCMGGDVLWGPLRSNEYEDPIIIQKTEKNWMPLILPATEQGASDRLLFVYSFDPTTIIETVIPQVWDGSCVIKKLQSAPSPYFRLSDLRGSSQCIPWSSDSVGEEDGYLVIGHESFREELPWRYLHRFVELDNKFIIRRISNLFQFNHPGVEFCAGLALSHKHDKEELLISYGVEDRQAFLARISVTDVKNQLRASGATGNSTQQPEAVRPVAPKTR